jgi:hypothetical protein
MKKKRRPSRAELEALDARTEESIRRLRALAEKGQAELEVRKAKQQNP